MNFATDANKEIDVGSSYEMNDLERNSKDLKSPSKNLSSDYYVDIDSHASEEVLELSLIHI